MWLESRPKNDVFLVPKVLSDLKTSLVYLFGLFLQLFGTFMNLFLNASMFLYINGPVWIHLNYIHDPVLQCWPGTTVLTWYYSSDPVLQFWPSTTVLTQYYSPDPGLQFWPGTTVLTQYYNADPVLQFWWSRPRLGLWNGLGLESSQNTRCERRPKLWWMASLPVVVTAFIFWISSEPSSECLNMNMLFCPSVKLFKAYFVEICLQKPSLSI